jgi:hypothetical protein
VDELLQLAFEFERTDGNGDQIPKPMSSMYNTGNIDAEEILAAYKSRFN